VSFSKNALGEKRRGRAAILGCVGVLLLVCLGRATASDTSQPVWRSQLEGLGIRFITAQTLKGMMDGGESFVLIDARDEVWYRQGHIPGAISIPAEDAPLEAVDVQRPKRLLYPERLPVDRGRWLIFYCGGPT
jgi:rhodanese-related sulfurtransferase